MPKSGEVVLVGEDRYLKNKDKWVAGILKYRQDFVRLGPKEGNSQSVLYEVGKTRWRV